MGFRNALLAALGQDGKTYPELRVMFPTKSHPDISSALSELRKMGLADSAPYQPIARTKHHADGWKKPRVIWRRLE